MSANTVWLRKNDDGHIDVVDRESLADFAVEADQADVDRWAAAQAIADEAQRQLWALYDMAEEAESEAILADYVPNPDNPPGPIRGLFPATTTSANVIALFGAR